MTNLHHLGYKLPHDLPLHPIQFIILCGSSTRAETIAHKLNPNSVNICLTDRYTLHHPIPQVLIASHGIGTGSIDPLLHELHHLLTSANARGYKFIRVGTCGGLGVSPGTMVVTRRPVDGLLRPSQRFYVLGKEVFLPARLDETLSTSLFRKASEVGKCVMADTLSAETFHLAQARCDGAFVMYEQNERNEFFERCRDVGVGNIEMESLTLAAFATRMDVPAAVLCVVLVDRLVQETPSEEADVIQRYIDTAVEVVVEFVKEHIRR